MRLLGIPLVGVVFALGTTMLHAEPVRVHPYRLDAAIVLTSEAGWKLLASNANANLQQVLADPATDAVELRGLRMEVDEMNSVDMHQDLHWPESLKSKHVSSRRPASNRLGATLDLRIMEVRDQVICVEVHLEQTTLFAWEVIPPFGHCPIIGRRQRSAELECPVGTWAIVHWPKQDAPEQEGLFSKGAPGDDRQVTGLVLRVRKASR
jgi:hypothetical protein